MSDRVNRPAHYTRSAVEPIDVIDAWGLDFYDGQVIKYIARAGYKGDRLEDYEKARWYLERKIKRLKQASEIEAALAELRDAPAVEMRGVVELDLSEVEP